MTQHSEKSITETQFAMTPSAQLRHWFPWIRLLRAFQVAIGFRPMALAFVGVLLWSFATWGFLQLNQDAKQTGIMNTLDATALGVPPENFQSIQQQYQPNPRIVTSHLNALAPLKIVFLTNLPFTVKFQALLQLLVGLLVSCICGAAISRIVAYEFTGRGDIGLFKALRFSTSRLPSLLGAPMIPVLGILMFWIPNLILGLLGKLPGVGEQLIGLLWFLPLIFGTLMALILVGAAAGWPLMVVAVSADLSDAFDALSRAYSYLFNQIWSVLMLVLFYMFYASISFGLVSWIVSLADTLAMTSVAGGSGEAVLEGAFNDTFTFRAWRMLFLTIPSAYLFSLFWTVVTMAYFLLRLKDDGTPLSAMALEEGSDGDDLPLVGIAAAKHRESQLNQSSDQQA